MNIKVIGLILPWETYFLPKIVSKFISCKNYLSKEESKNITFSLCYSNVPEQIDWDNSSAIPLHTENIFNKCCKLLNQYYDVNYKIDNNIKGCVGHRRLEFNKDDYDYCVTFDPDMNFPSTLLKAYSDAVKLFNKEDLLVFTPQTTVMWDETWQDVCCFNVNSRNEYYKHPARFNIDLIQPNKDKLQFNMTQVNSKWYGGMFPCYSKGYLKEYPLPKQLGDGYGPDDYYLLLKGLNGSKKHSQYLIEGLIVENSKKYWDFFTNKENYKFNYFAQKIDDKQLFELI